MITRFTIRVALHTGYKNYDPLDSDIYRTLKAAMLDQGFSDTVTLDDLEYELPVGEYIRDGIDLSANDIRAAAIIAANTTAKDFTIVVTQCEGKRLYWNLREVNSND